jgi:hypothetical protein
MLQPALSKQAAAWLRPLMARRVPAATSATCSGSSSSAGNAACSLRDEERLGA